MSKIWRRLMFIFGRRKFDGELRDEMREHLEMKARKLMDSGVAPEEARYRAQWEFGNPMLMRDQSRDLWQWRPVAEIAQDLRYALRMLRRSPGFTAVAIVSLALGIGANTAVFSVMDTVLLKSLPVEDPGNLVLVTPECKGEKWIFMNPTFRDLRDRQQVFSGMVAISDEARMVVTFPGDEQQEGVYVPGAIVSGNYFSVLGVRPLIGRMFTEADDQIPRGSQERAAVISFGFWQRRFGGDPGAIGRRLNIAHQAYAIVGVAPREFRGHQTGYAPDIWAPMNHAKSPEDLSQRHWAFFSGVMARLKPGVSSRQAETAMTALYQQILTGEVGQGMAESLRTAGPSQPPDRNISDYHISLKPGGGGLGILRDKYEDSLRIIMAVVGLVLLIACSNVANLLLARAASRRSEIGLRLALGSGRFRLMRQLLTESVLLAVIAAVGLLVAYWFGDGLAAFISVGWLPMSLRIVPDARVLAFTAAVSFAAAFLFGVVPAWQATQLEVSPALKGFSGSQSDGRPRQRFSRVLLVSQVALSLVLLASAGLMARTLANLHHFDPGFRLQNVLMLEVHMEQVERVQGKPDFAVAQKQLPGVFRNIEEKLNALAGVRSASISWLGLFSENDLSTSLVIRGITLAGQPTPAHLNMVSSRYFETVGMQVVLGRGFNAHDDERSHKVMMINEALARKYILGQNPLGKLAVMPNVDELKDTPFEIVGVLRDAKYNDLRAPAEPMFYLPLSQAPYPIQSVEVHTAGDPMVEARQVRRVLRETQRDLMIGQITTLAQLVDGTVVRETMLAELSGVFGVLALVLACVGLYGTMSYAVMRRTSEIGIRMALGARRGEMLWMVLRETLLLVGTGVAIGLPASIAATRFLQDYLFELKPTDPATIAGAALMLAAIAVFAGYLPARRAARVDPMTALRYE